MREFLIDTHAHTIASGHAYNTIDEVTREAADKGIKLISITEHAPQMPGSYGHLYFSNLRVIPRNKYGVRRLFGCEANIMNFNGDIDMKEYELRQMEIVIASFHTPCIKPGSVEENTSAIIRALNNPYIDIIGHPDDSRYPVDYEKIVVTAKNNHKLLELNNASLRPSGPRVGAYENDKIMLELCKREKVCISLGSDAHIAESICDFGYAYQLLEEVDFPEELIANSNEELLFSYLPRLMN